MPAPTPEPDPAALERRLDERLRRDGRLSADSVEVRVHDDAVELRGAVQSHRRKLAALEIATEVAPGLPVRDRLRVSEGAFACVDGVREELRRRLGERDGLPHETIEVRVRNGRVRLSGLVATPAQRLEAENVALATPGVRGVRNLLVVDPVAQSREAERSGGLRTMLRERLGPAAGTLRVVSTGLRVVLEGDVSDAWYRARAAELVHLRGVLRVRNRIRVRGAA